MAPLAIRSHYVTPAHEAVIAARTQAHAQYHQHYLKALADIESVRATLVDEERKDFEYLTNALAALRKQHGIKGRSKMNSNFDHHTHANAQTTSEVK